MSEREKILKSLEPLFAEAEAKGLWFRSHYQGIALSPKEMRAEHAKGRLIWGRVNWELIDPKTLLRDEKKELDNIRKHNEGILKRV